MDTKMINNSEWLAGYAARRRGDGCPWGSESARLGWIARKIEEEGAAR